MAAILPDTVSSTRYVEFDAPYLTEAMKDAGLARPRIFIVNAHGSDATEFADAQADITKGDKVLIMDPLDSGVGAKIESYAAAHGVKVIDYDRLTLGGNRTYYDSFNNNFVGTLLGQGLVNCVASEHVSKPVVLVMHGARPTTTRRCSPMVTTASWTRTSPRASGHGWKLQPNEAGRHLDSEVAGLTEFQQEYTAHSNINAVLMPNDENGAPIITYLKSKGIKANTFPVTGQDATLTGLGNVLTGYQCGTVYKPDGGEIRWEGRQVHLHTPKDASDLGIATVYQDLALADNLDIVQNMFLGREPVKHFVLDEIGMEKTAKQTLADLSVVTVRSVRQPVGSLSGGQRQAVAVARAVMRQAKLVILDEPTAALGVTQTRVVLDLIQRLKSQNIAVIVISHNLNDVQSVADRIAVLRLGQLVAVGPAAQFDAESIVDFMTTGTSRRFADVPADQSSGSSSEH